MKKTLFFFAFALLTLVATARTASSPIVKEHVRQLLKEYIAVKTAVVNANTRSIRKTSAQLIETAQAFDVSKLNAEERAFYEQYTKQLIAESQALQTISDIEAQREHFKSLSAAMVELVKGNNYASKFAANGEGVALKTPETKPEDAGNVLEEEGGRKIKLCYCGYSHGYWLSYEGEDEDNPYVGK